MLISFKDIVRKYGKPEGILHVGANIGEEAKAYLEMGVFRQIWIEANPEIFSILQQKVTALPNQFDNNQLFFCNFCIGDVDGQEVNFHVSNNGSQSSSILELGTHKYAHPDVHYVRDIPMKTHRIDTVFNRLKESKNEHGYNAFDPDKFDFLNIDLQGAELMALRGMGDLLKQFKYAYLEINKQELYKGCALWPEVEKYMKGFGFVTKEIKMSGNSGWGDCLMVKR